jgi:uncharacterized peroxidase-related enzyme
MPFIKVIDEIDAEGELKQIYDSITFARGKLSNIMRIHSLLPQTMIKHLEFYSSIMFSKTSLTREEKELIAVVVSSANKCDYCVSHHSEALNHYWKNEAKIKKVIENFRDNDFSPKMNEALNYAFNLTTNPGQVNEKDTIALRSAGWNDDDILTINLVIGYFNFVNRIAAGLGVEFSEAEVKGYKY